MSSSPTSPCGKKPFGGTDEPFDEMIITEENRAFFVAWATTMRPDQIDGDAFETMLVVHLDQWVRLNNVKWVFAYSLIVDAIKEQKIIEAKVQERNAKPVERRAKCALLASFYDKDIRHAVAARKASPRAIPCGGRPPTENVKLRSLSASPSE